MDAFLKILQSLPEVAELVSRVENGGCPAVLTGTAPVQRACVGAAVAAGAAAGGWEDIYGAIRALCPPDKTVYFPVEENHRVYDRLFAEYTRLHDLFGRGENDVMRRLRAL